MSYARLGTFCYPQGNAITSNHKYLSPFSDVYQKHFTEMRKYPGTAGIYGDNIPGDTNPEHIRAYYSKDSSPKDILSAPYEHIPSNNRNLPDTAGSCTKCGTR
jgi:hypothetical protein